MLFLTSVLLAAMLGAPLAEPMTESTLLDAPERHIRTTDPIIKSFLKRGLRQSSTFAAIVMRLQQSDVIVYVEGIDRLPNSLEGRLTILPVPRGFRYVRIQLRMRFSLDDSIALLGHELQHAVEIAEASDVRDEKGLAKLYQRIGMNSGEHIYDTAAAQEMGRIVRRELSS